MVKRRPLVLALLLAPPSIALNLACCRAVFSSWATAFARCRNKNATAPRRGALSIRQASQVHPIGLMTVLRQSTQASVLR